jgi:hypothetical protein
MHHQDVDTRAKDLLSRWPQPLAALGRCLVALAIYVGGMALVILGSHMQTDPAEWEDYPFLEHPIVIVLFLSWWVFFPLIAGLWVRSFWWVPLAWQGPLLLSSIEPTLGAEQATAFLNTIALITAIGGVALGRSNERRKNRKLRDLGDFLM